jgi:hypothetical protein
LEQPETAETCQGCGLIFAKWRERQQAASSVTPPEPAAAQTPEPAEAGTSPESGTDQAPPQPEANPWKKPLPERQYQEFPVKKMAFISIPILVAAAVYSFWPGAKTDGYATPKPIERPTSIYGNATEQPSPEATWTPLPCGYPDNTCTPTPIATPMTISGPAWQYHGKVVDYVHLSAISGVQIVFTNHGVAVTVVTNDQGFYHISVPPLSSGEAYEVQLSHQNFGDRYWTDDPSGLELGTRLAKGYENPENQHFRIDGVAQDRVADFSMFPYQLNEQERMQMQNARPPSQP